MTWHIKRTIHPNMKIQSLYTHTYADGRFLIPQNIYFLGNCSFNIM